MQRAGITAAAGTGLALQYIGHSSITLGYKMSLPVGLCLTKGQPDPKADQMSS